MSKGKVIALYDSRCLELAEYFLTANPSTNSPQNKVRLAGHIQSAIEDWLEWEIKTYGGVGRHRPLGRRKRGKGS